mgnify:CR=1 FL=1
MHHLMVQVIFDSGGSHGVLGFEHVVEGVELLFGSNAERAGDQMEIMVAEHGLGAGPKALHEAEHAEVVRPAVDQVADEAQLVARRAAQQLVHRLPEQLPARVPQGDVDAA